MERSVADVQAENEFVNDDSATEAPERNDSSGTEVSTALRPNVKSSDPALSDAVTDSTTIDSAWHPLFVFSYIANLALVTANATTFVFADWVAWLATNQNSGVPYQEELPGRIVQYGILAAICGRIFLGQSIDRFGVRRVWVTVSCLGLAGVAIFASLQTMSPLLPVGRILLATGLAGMFTCSTFHIQSCVAEHRRTEFIALLGSSGFVGMILGTQLADFLRWITDENSSTFFPSVFGTAVALFCLYIICVLIITRGIVAAEHPSTRPSLLRLTKDYWPGMITLVSMMMGVIFTVPSLYLIRFNQHEDLGGIATYWTTYALTAFAFRIKTAGLSQKVGRHRLVFVGLMGAGNGAVGAGSGDRMVAPVLFRDTLRFRTCLSVSVHRFAGVRHVSGALSWQRSQPDAGLSGSGCRTVGPVTGTHHRHGTFRRCRISSDVFLRRSDAHHRCHHLVFHAQKIRRHRSGRCRPPAGVSCRSETKVPASVGR